MLRSLSAAVFQNAAAYVLFQRLIGATRMREQCIEALDLSSGDRVLDVGCGPAYYVEDLPSDVDYYGFDTNAHYIAHARRRFGRRGRFFCETFEDRRMSELPRFDAVMLMGLLHHLPEDACHALLERVARSLAPGGRVVTLDTCFDRRLSTLGHWLARHDRGEYVRWTSELERIAARRFAAIQGRLLGGSWRAPVALYSMLLRDPRVEARSAA